MGTQISVYDRVSQARMLLVEDNRPFLLRERYFPTIEPRDLFVSKSVLLDFDEGDFLPGAFVTRGYVGGNTTTYYANNVVPPRVAPSDAIDTDDKDRQLFESLCQNDLSPDHADAMNALLMIKGKRLLARVSRSIEKLIVSALQNNAIQFTCDHSPTDHTQDTIDIEYFDSSNGGTNPQVFTPVHNWGTDGSTPYDDVCKMITTLVNHGGQGVDLLMSETMWGYLYHDMITNTFKDQINYTGVANGNVRDLFSAEIDGAKCVGGAQFCGHYLNLIVYNAGFKESKNAPFTLYLPDDFVCVLAPGCGRTLCGACTLPNPYAIVDEKAAAVKQIAAPAILYRFVDVDHERVELRCQANPLPAPLSEWRWISYKSAT